MNRMKSVLAGTGLIMLAVITGCSHGAADPREAWREPIDPAAQPDELSRALKIKGRNFDGAPPAASDPSLQITAAQASASVTADNVLYLPFEYVSTSAVQGLYVWVDGAQNYWDVTLPDAGVRGTQVVPIGIPRLVLAGNFTLRYQLHDAQGRVGNGASLPTAIVAPVSGSGGPQLFATVLGSDGLTVRTYDMGADRGTVTIRWETYTVPDRIDIRYGGEWIRSTGTSLDQLQAPPVLDCSAAGSADGFVGSSGTFSFDLVPGHGGQVDVYVSGCLNGGTQWYFQVGYSGAVGSTTANLPDCPCNRAAVVLGDTRDGSGQVTGRWSDWTAPTLDKLHPGAVSDIRWSPTNPQTPAGQQCNYDRNGRLITSGLGAGTYDRISPGISSLGHWISDVQPWSSTPCVEYYTKWPANRGSGCYSNSVTPFEHMAAMTRGMTCPEIRDLIDVISTTSFATATVRDYVQGTLGYTPDVETLKTDLLKILKNDSSGGGRLEPVAKAYVNLGGKLSAERLEALSTTSTLSDADAAARTSSNDSRTDRSNGEIGGGW